MIISRTLFFILLLNLGLMDVVAQNSEQVEISGVVRSEEGPLEGVNILVEGSDNGTQTNSGGEFSIEANPRDILIFSYVGMKTAAYRVPRNSRTVLIEMEPRANELDEVVVRGRNKKLEIRSLPTKPPSYHNAFGEVDLRKKGTSTYYVSGDELNLAAPSLEAALAQKIPGGLSRGTNSLNVASASLYEVDGQLYNDISWLDWRGNIKEVFVEKSLAGTLKYGFLGRGGVVIIKTRQNADNLRRIERQEAVLNKETYQKDAFPYAQKYIEYEKAARYDPDVFSVYVAALDGEISRLRALAYACQAADAHERAIQVYRQILALNPKDERTVRDLAHALALSGRAEMAWNTYLLGRERNQDQFDQRLSEIEFQEMQNLYATEDLAAVFPNALVDSPTLEGMKQPITRLVVEWVDPKSSFLIEAVNPKGQVSRIEINQGGQRVSIEEFFLDSTISGEWQFNLEGLKANNQPLLLKISIFRNWGRSKATPEIKLYKFSEDEVMKYKLLTLKV